MSSIAYDIMLGLVGILTVGAVYSILDQVNMGELYNLTVRMMLNGDYVNIFVWLWALIPITITVAVIIGWYAKAHFARNEV